MRMWMTGFSREIEKYLYHAPTHRFCLRKTVGGLKQLCQVVELCGNVWMLCAKTRLINLQGAAHERFCLRQPVGGLKQLCQVVEVSGYVRVVLAKTLLINLQGAAHERFCLRMVGGVQKK